MRRPGLLVRDWNDQRPTAALAKLIERAESIGVALEYTTPAAFALTWDTFARCEVPGRAAPLGTPFDCRINNLTDDNSLFLIGRDKFGWPVAMQAARLHRFGASNLAAQANRLTLFFDDPAKQADPGDYAICTCLSAPQISGDVVRPGATWLHKSKRGPQDGGWNFSQVIGRTARTIAYTLWDPQYFVTFVGEALETNAQITAKYGYSHREAGMRMRLRSIEQDAHLLWMDMDEFRHDLEAVAKGDLRKPDLI